MQCPSGCHTSLHMSERLGVEVDYCPTCRGVWLDRGELDKLLERAVRPSMEPTAVAYAGTASPQVRGYEPRYDDRPYVQRQHDSWGHKKKSKKKHLLEELFDF